MTQKIRAILIDPFNETVSEVEYNGDYKQIYTLLSHETHPVDTFTVVDLGGKNKNALFVDDNGLLNNPTHFFVWKGYAQPLAGKGLILGTDDEGESIATDLTTEYVKSHVQYANNLELVGMQEFKDTVDHPILGPNTPRFGSRPVFRVKR